MCAGHFTLAVVTDRISLICRPRNKYSRERRQPATSSDRVGDFISGSVVILHAGLFLKLLLRSGWIHVETLSVTLSDHSFSFQRDDDATV